MHGLLVGEDALVANWAHTTYRLVPQSVNQAIGILDNCGKLVGAAILHNYNGSNIELSYYGPKTLSVGIVRFIARCALGFNIARGTVVTSRRNKKLMQALLKCGFRVEGSMRCYFGQEDIHRNIGIRFVIFKERIMEIAYPQGLRKVV